MTEKIEQSYQQMLLSMAQMQVQINALETMVIAGLKEHHCVISHLLTYQQKRDELLAKASEADKQRWQERWLKMWSVLGPMLSACITAWFGHQ